MRFMWGEKGQSVIEKLRQGNQGRKILSDWLGENAEPVPIEQAQARANTCLSGGPPDAKGNTRCPSNYAGTWLWNMATALAIASQMGLREVMQLELAGEDKLNVCEICGCNLKLKVHVPFRHIYRHTSDELFAKYPPWCWQKKELNQIRTNDHS